MKEKTNNPAIDVSKLTLRQIKIFKSHLEANEAFRNVPEAVHEFVIETATKTAFNFSEKLCRFTLFVKFAAVDKEKNPLGLEAEYGIDFHFHIDNLNDYLVHKEGNEVQVDSILGSTLCGISYSTARGIILQKMHGSYFEGVILPIVDPSQLLKPESST